MSANPSQREAAHKRIDELLLEGGIVTEDDLAVALNRQKAMGGTLCSHLLDCGSASEESLVRALSEQFGVPGVELENSDIPDSALKLIPKKYALSRRVLPFDYDVENNVVHLACMDPHDSDLAVELGHIFKDKNIELYVAVELSLRQAISHCYGEPEEEDDPFGFNEDDETYESGKVKTASKSGSEPVLEMTKHRQKAVLLVTDQTSTAHLLKILFEKDGYVVDHSSSSDDAIDFIQRSEYEAVLIQRTAPGNSHDLANRVHAISPVTHIRHFGAITDIFLSNSPRVPDIGKLQQQIEMFTSLLTLKERAPRSQNPRMTHFAEKLARKMSLPSEQRVLIQSAAHLLERAKFYYTHDAPRDFRRLLELVVKLLQSVYYEPQVVDILRWMYVDVRDRDWDEPPFLVLAGNILTMVDLYCEAFPPTRRTTMDKLDEFQSAIKPKVGTELLPDVVEHFLAVAQEETLRVSSIARTGQIMVYSDRPQVMVSLVDQLQVNGLRTISAITPNSLVRLYQRSRPDLMVLGLHGSARAVLARVSEIRNLGIDLTTTPTFVTTEKDSISDLTPLLEWGIEDILDSDADAEQVALKICKAWARMNVETTAATNDAANLDTKGSLQDLNLIELLQVIGASRRTVKITVVSASRPDESLEIFINNGHIVFAELNDVTGAEAIYVGITWDKGTWTIEPTTEKELRGQNNELSNEAILLEGCRLIDEMNTAGSHSRNASGRVRV